jgi:hypothetical protein
MARTHQEFKPLHFRPPIGIAHRHPTEKSCRKRIPGRKAAAIRFGSAAFSSTT